METTSARRIPEQLVSVHPLSFKGPSERIRSLAAISLASKIGYLKTSDLAGPDSLEIDEFITDRARVGMYREGEYIFPSDDVKSCLLVLRRGTVSILRPSPGGRRLFIKSVEAGAVFGEMPSIGQSMLGSEAEASSPTEVAILSEADIEEMFQRFRGLAVRLVARLGPKLVDAEKRHERTAFHTVTGRVASLLLDLAPECNLVSGLTHLDLAEMLGVYRETVTVAIADLKRAGLIKVERRRITVLDPVALRGLSLL
jgi:CRP/FNR family cyclic AMP-dependent transcriptional regulator